MCMKVIAIVLVLAFAAVLPATTLVGASDIPVDEKRLNTSGMAVKINYDPEGYLYVSDRYALNGGLEGEIGAYIRAPAHTRGSILWGGARCPPRRKGEQEHLVYDQQQGNLEPHRPDCHKQ